MTEIVDLVGNILNVGDTVVHITVPYGTNRIEGGTSIITKVIPDSNKIQILNYYWSSSNHPSRKGMTINEIRKSTVQANRVVKTFKDKELIKALKQYEKKSGKKYLETK